MNVSDEIITFQAGPLANRIMAHFWSLQWEYFDLPSKPDAPIPSSQLAPYFQSNVLFHTDSSVVRPRTMVVDTVGSVDHGFYVDEASSSVNHDCFLWTGQIDTIIRSPEVAPVAVPAAAAAAAGPHVPIKWTACLTPRLRKIWCENQTIRLAPEHVNAPTVRNVHSRTEPAAAAAHLSSFTQGSELLRPGTIFMEELEDQLRRLAENCSRPSGFQVVVDAENGFSGVGSAFLDHLLDEFSNRSVLGIPVYDSCTTISMSRKSQLIAKANQMLLALRFEPTPESFTNSTWFPLDVAALDVEQVCLSTGVLAATLDTLTTPFRLESEYGGVFLDQFVFESQRFHNKRMLSASIGYTTWQTDDHPWLWKALNPYHLPGAQKMRSTPKLYSSSECSLWRQVVLRGLSLNPFGSHCIQYVSAPTESERGFNNNPTSNWCSLLPQLRCPTIHPGVKVRAYSCLADLPLVRPPRSKVIVKPTCQQPEVCHLVSILDAPAYKSSESEGLRQLIGLLQSNCQRSILDGMELDIWKEHLETGRTYLADAYSKSDAFWHS